MILLAINWSEVAVKAGQFILSFSIIVVLHEMGHFLPAKWFKCRVEKFYLFFNPYFSLFKKKIGETEYGLGWVPFGGYVKISGMIDESMDKDAMKLPPQPYEFRSKPAWQRLIIMVGGVTVNLILGFLIYAMMLWYWGESFVPTDKMKYGIATDSLAQSIGLRDGDKIKTVDGKFIQKFRLIPYEVVLKRAKTMQVERSGQPVNISIPDNFAGLLIKNKVIAFMEPRYPFTGVDSVLPDYPAARAGIKSKDKILTVNGLLVPFFGDFRNEVQKSKLKKIEIQVLRGADTMLKQLVVPADGKIGIYQMPAAKGDLVVDSIKYSFLSAIPAGFTRSVETIQGYWLQLKLIFSKDVKASESVGSVISISKMFPGQWDWQQFWGLTAFFSLVLAFMNILPIPALDGGHALFTLYEMISGRKPSDKFIEYSQMIGMILLLGLMAYALGLDIFRLFK
ncbi:MAG: RIP metalloprotease RseP [Chitinophagaceae bacterium]